MQAATMPAYRKPARVLAVATVVAALLLALGAPSAQAAAYKTATNASTDYTQSIYKAKVGKVTVKAKGKFDYSKGGTFYKLTVTKNGKTKVVSKKADYMFTTNGTYVYYAVQGARTTTDQSSLAWMWGHRKNTIYRYNVKTGAKKKIVSGTDIVPYGAQGKYLYYGKYNSAASDTKTLYARNVKTGAKRKLAGDTFDGVCNGRVICHNWSNAEGGMPLYSYAKAGTGKILISNRVLGVADLVKVKGKKIRFVETDGYDFRAVTCNAKGTGLKALSGWTTYSAAKSYL